MKRLSARAGAYIGIGLLLVIAAAFSLLNKHLEARQAAQISDDALSAGIVERWGAALPAGFEKETAGAIADGAGLQFARLVYEEDIGGLLAKWTPPDADTQARFDELIDAFLGNAENAENAENAPAPEEAAWLRDARPVLDAGWICFSLQSEADARDVILLAYQSESRVMFLAERQEWET